MGRTVSLAALTNDSKASITGSTTCTTVYNPTSATLTVQAENPATVQTYTVTFQVIGPEQAPALTLNGEPCVDEQQIYIAKGDTATLQYNLGGGSIGAHAYIIQTRNTNVVMIDNTQSLSAGATYTPLSTGNWALGAKGYGTAQIEVAFYAEFTTNFTGLTPIMKYTLQVYTEADYTQLDAALLTAPADLGLYTPDSVNSLQDILDGIIRTKTYLQQAEVDAYEANVQQAIADLELLADYSAVDAAIAAAPLQCAVYTQTSVQNLNMAIANVNRGKGISEQSVVDGYAADIRQAIALLEYIADYTAVNAALAAIPKDLSIYTPASIEAMQKAIAKIIYGKGASEQAAVNGYAVDLFESIYNLQLLAVENEKTPDNTKSTTPLTGDMQSAWWCSLLCICSVAIWLCYVKKAMRIKK